MKTTENEKNLKHGYLFLTSILLVLFSFSLATEIYLKGGFKFDFNKTDNNEITTDNSTKDEHPEITLEFQNLTDGYKTKEASITVVVLTNTGNSAWLNSAKVDVNQEGIFEQKINLITGQNEIIAEVENANGDKKQKRIVVTREEEPKPTIEPQTPTNTQKPVVQPEPKVEPKTDPKPTPEPQPQPNPITGLKLNCSITNTQPSVGQNVSLDCTVKDQNANGVNGATGSVTVNWQSGSANYNLPSSNNGSTSISFTVPAGNSGKVSGNIRASKDGLTVNSNFSITVL